MDRITAALFLESVERRMGDQRTPDFVRDLVGNVLHEYTDSSTVYLIPVNEDSGDTCYLKIGMARDVRKRILAHQTSCPLAISKAMYFCLNTDRETYALEKALHRVADEYRIHGEWFQFENRKQRANAVEGLVAHVENELGLDFNCWVFNMEQDNHPRLNEVRGFVGLVRMMNDPSFDGGRFQDAMVEANNLFTGRPIV